MEKIAKAYLDQLPPTREVVDLYKSKLEKCRKDFSSLLKNMEQLKQELEDRSKLEQQLESAEEKLHSMGNILSRTQALLIAERSNSQQMALHIDLLQKQHDMDREKLDLLLALDGKPIPNHYFQGELILKQQISKMDKLVKEQAARFLDERSLMKAEWDREKHFHDKIKRDMKFRIQSLQQKVVNANEHRILFGQKQIENLLNGETCADVQIDYFDDCCSGASKGRESHCATQEMKKLKKKLDGLLQELESYQRKCVIQTNTIEELKEDIQKRQDRFQGQAKAMKEQLERLRDENNNLNKRRLTEGSGFRAEIKLLRDQLQRTQRQLCFLTVRKFEE